MPIPKPDPEKVESTEDDELFDDIQDPDHPFSKYPPPRKNPIFRRHWKSLITNLTERDNFNETLLPQLEILCDLYAEYEQLNEFLRINGFTYEAHGRQGKQIKPFPEVGMIQRCKSEIRNYTRMLGLIASKDRGGTADKKDKWD